MKYFIVIFVCLALLRCPEDPNAPDAKIKVINNSDKPIIYFDNYT